MSMIHCSMKMIGVFFATGFFRIVLISGIILLVTMSLFTLYIHSIIYRLASIFDIIDPTEFSRCPLPLKPRFMHS